MKILKNCMIPVFHYPVTLPAAKVSPLKSPRTGEAVKNQFVIRIHSYNLTAFQSYETECLRYDSRQRVLTVFPEAFGRSVTTSKYSRAFLMDEIGLDSAAAEEVKKIARGESFDHDCPLYIEI